jgi:hypothetical protein
MVRPVINTYQMLGNYQPRVAVIEDKDSPAYKKVLELIKEAGGKAMIIPRFLSDRLLATQGLDKGQIQRIKRARSWDEVREFDQQIATATRLHLQYITRKLTFVDAVVLPGLPDALVFAWRGANRGPPDSVEAVLGDYLEAVCIDTLDAVASSLDRFDKGHVMLIESGAGEHSSDAQSLSAQVQGPAAPYGCRESQAPSRAP